LIVFAFASEAMISAQTRIAETVDHFYQGSGDNDYTGSRYKQVADQLDVDCKELLVIPAVNYLDRSMKSLRPSEVKANIRIVNSR